MRIQKSKLVGNPKRNKDESMIILVGPKKSLCNMAKLLTLNEYKSIYTLEEQKDSTKFKNYVLLVTNKPDCKEFRKMPMHWYKYYHDPKINSLPKLNTYYIPKEYWEVFILLKLTHFIYWRTWIDYNGNLCPGGPGIRTTDDLDNDVINMSNYTARRDLLKDGKLTGLSYESTSAYDIQNIITWVKNKELIPLTETQWDWRCKQWMKQWEKRYGK